jgi:hypothetical protein
MEPRALPDIQDKDTAARAGPEIIAERVGRALNFLPLTISLRDEVVSEGSSRLVVLHKLDLGLPVLFPFQRCLWHRQQGFTGAIAMFRWE